MGTTPHAHTSRLSRIAEDLAAFVLVAGGAVLIAFASTL